MAIHWLPFYDLGGKLPADTPIDVGSMDLHLFAFLSYKVRSAVKDRRVIPAVFAVQPPGLSTVRIRPDWLAFIAEYAQSKGFPTTAPNAGPNCCIEPHKAGATSLIAGLNALYYKFFPKEYLDPSFTFATAGSINIATLPGQMLLKSCWRSAFTPQQATSKGPQREVAFYDVSAPFGPGKTNKLADQALVSMFLKAIYNHSPAGITGPIIGQNAIFGPEAVANFGTQVAALGWNVDPNVVYPAYGNTTAPSVIRAMNYYYMMCLPYLAYDDMSNHSQVMAQPVLSSSFAVNKKSLYFLPV